MGIFQSKNISLPVHHFSQGFSKIITLVLVSKNKPAVKLVDADPSSTDGEIVGSWIPGSQLSATLDYILGESLYLMYILFHVTTPCSVNDPINIT